MVAEASSDDISAPTAEVTEGIAAVKELKTAPAMDVVVGRSLTRELAIEASIEDMDPKIEVIEAISSAGSAVAETISVLRDASAAERAEVGSAIDGSPMDILISIKAFCSVVVTASFDDIVAEGTFGMRDESKGLTLMIELITEDTEAAAVESLARELKTEEREATGFVGAGPLVREFSIDARLAEGTFPEAVSELRIDERLADGIVTDAATELRIDEAEPIGTVADGLLVKESNTDDREANGTTPDAVSELSIDERLADGIATDAATELRIDETEPTGTVADGLLVKESNTDDKEADGTTPDAVSELRMDERLAGGIVADAATELRIDDADAIGTVADGLLVRTLIIDDIRDVGTPPTLAPEVARADEAAAPAALVALAAAADKDDTEDASADAMDERLDAPAASTEREVGTAVDAISEFDTAPETAEEAANASEEETAAEDAAGRVAAAFTNDENAEAREEIPDAAAAPAETADAATGNA